MKKEWILVGLSLIITGFLVFDTAEWIFNRVFNIPQEEYVFGENNSRTKPNIFTILWKENVEKAEITVQESNYQAGIGILIYENDGNFQLRIKSLLNYLVDLNINSVNLAFPIFQDNWTSTHVFADEDITISEENLRFFIKEAKKRNLTVMIRPIIDEDSLHVDGKWRGSIRPSNTKLWFESYGKVLLQYAVICEEEKAEILAIGTELTSLESKEEEWRNLIKKVREVYSGELIYAANWYKFDEYVNFWDDLDYIGIDAFFPLITSANATEQELIEAWQPWIEKINELKDQFNKPVIFTEIGVVSQTGSHRAPWKTIHNMPLDLKAQELYYLSTFKATKEDIDGLYWWFITLHFPEEPENNTHFNPIGKPAEKVMQDEYGQILNNKAN